MRRGGEPLGLMFRNSFYFGIIFLLFQSVLMCECVLFIFILSYGGREEDVFVFLLSSLQ